MGWGFAFTLGLILVFYLLYINGLLVFSAKTAVVFAGYVRRNGNAQLRFASCNGQIKRVIRFRDPGIYHFIYRSAVSDGTITVKVLDAEKREIISCTGMNYETKLEAERKKRYYLVFLFRNATGNCSVMWR